MIKVYSSITQRFLDESYPCDGRTIDAWMADHAPGYIPSTVQPVSISINGEIIPPSDWVRVKCNLNDDIEIRVQPKSSKIDKAIGYFTGVRFFTKALDWIIDQSIDAPKTTRAGERGSEISSAEAKANRPKLGGQIPELFGTYIRYPDYLNQPRRYFIDQTTQALDVFLSVGAGEFDIPEAKIKIGETPIGNLTGVVDYEIFGPGDDVSGNQNHLNWYNAPEVGAAVGSSGLRLKGVEDDYTHTPNASYFTFSGQNITIESGAGSFPADWEAGLKLQIFVLKSMEVVDGGIASSELLRDLIEGYMRPFVATDEVTIAGDIEGDYVVDTFADGAPDQLTLDSTSGNPVVNLTSGAVRIEVDYTGVTYEIDSVSSLSMTVTRLNPDGSEDLGWTGFDEGAESDAIIRLDGAYLDGIWSGPFLACPENESTDTVEFDVFAPGGIGKSNSNGGMSELTRSIEIEYRDADVGGPWTSATYDVSAGSRNQLGWTFTLDLGSSYTPEIRMRRTSLEDNSTSVTDRYEWIGLRSKLDTVTSYAGITTLAMTLTGSDALSNQSNNQINMECTRKLPELSGGTLSANTATRSIASTCIYIAESIGYTLDQLDLDEFERLDTIWSSRGDYYDYIVDSTTVSAAINNALRAGFAEMTVEDGIITPVRDEIRTTFEQSYSPANILAGTLTRSFQSRRSDDPDGVEVEYTNSDTWTKETVQCGLPGDLFTKVDSIKLDGVTGRDRAWRIGMRRRRAQKYRRWVYNFDTEMDALNSGYLSYVPIIDNVPGYGKASIIKSIVEGSPDRITLTEPMDWVDGESHVIAYRDDEGELVGPFSATRGDSDYEVLAELSPVPDLTINQEPPHAYFGISTQWNFPALITSVRPRGPASVSVQAVNYDSRVYADDNNTPE